MSVFFENPFVEGELVFSFYSDPGATRYETWENHLHVFQQLKKKAIDFIYSNSIADMIFFTEIKDFRKITKIGKYGNGVYSNTLADDIALKFKDSLDGFRYAASNSAYREEMDFSCKNQDMKKVAVFHWEISDNFSRQKRIHYMRLMTKKLRELLFGIFNRVVVENMQDNPSQYWHVTRV